MIKKLLILLVVATFCYGDAKGEKGCEVLSLGGAIIDYYFMVSDRELMEIVDEKGGWDAIDYKSFESILKQQKNAATIAWGGSSASMIKGLSQLGHRCAIVGKVGDDDRGRLYIDKIKNLGIETHFEKGALPTGQAICLVTPDGKRTFRTYLGASHSLSELKFDETIFKGKKLFHVEGYQLFDRDLVIKTFKLAKKEGMLISLDLGSLDVARRNKEFIEDILGKYVDILFCNEKEAKVLTDLSARESCAELAKQVDTVVITMSEKGSWVQRGSERIFMEAIPVTAVDSTGAGELYAAGFLHGHLSGYPLKKCAHMGALVASYVVKRVGADIPDEMWEDLREEISLMDKSPTPPAAKEPAQ